MVSLFIALYIVVEKLFLKKVSLKAQATVFVSIMFFSLIILGLDYFKVFAGIINPISLNTFLIIGAIEIFCAIYGLWCISNNNFSLPKKRGFVVYTILFVSIVNYKVQLLGVLISSILGLRVSANSVKIDKKSIITLVIVFMLFFQSKLVIPYLEVAILAGFIYIFSRKTDDRDIFNILVLLIVSIKLGAISSPSLYIVGTITTLLLLLMTIGNDHQRLIQMYLSQIALLNKLLIRYMNLKTSYIEIKNHSATKNISYVKSTNIKNRKIQRSNSLEVIGYLLTIINLIILVTMVNK